MSAVIIAGIIVGAIIMIPRWRAASIQAQNQTAQSDVVSTTDATATINKVLDGHDSTGEYGLKVGQMGQVDKLELTVVKTAAGAPNALGQATTTVELKIANKRSATVAIDPGAWSAIDRKEGDVAQVIDGATPPTALQIPAGQTATMTLTFAGDNIGRVVYSADDASQQQLSWRIP